MTKDQWKRWLADLFFPNRCPFCGRFIRWDLLICGECMDELPYLDASLCPRCQSSPCICEAASYDRCVAACAYSGLAREGVLQLKYHSAWNAADFFADVMAARLEGEGGPSCLLVPVPMPDKKRKARGYNQAECLAEAVSKRIWTPVSEDLLLAEDTGEEQHTLQREERMANAKKKFFLSPLAEPDSLRGKSVLLCDDVMTTGSTMEACAALLKQCGPERVTALAAAVRVLELG